MSVKIPKPVSVTVSKKNYKASLVWDSHFTPSMNKTFDKIQVFIDSECLRLMAPLTPMRTGNMIRSATMGTVIGAGEIKYLAPYARKQYYGNKGNGQRGKLWFERMKTHNLAYLKKGAGDYAKRKP